LGDEGEAVSTDVFKKLTEQTSQFNATLWHRLQLRSSNTELKSSVKGNAASMLETKVNLPSSLTTCTLRPAARLNREAGGTQSAKVEESLTNTGKRSYCRYGHL